MLAVGEAVQSGSQGYPQVKVFWMMPAHWHIYNCICLFLLALKTCLQQMYVRKASFMCPVMCGFCFLAVLYTTK